MSGGVKSKPDSDDKRQFEEALSVIDDTTFDEDDWNVVVMETSSLASNWEQICVCLGLPFDIIDNNVRVAGNCGHCWREALKEWIKQNYNTKRFGEPSWRTLLKAVVKVDRRKFQILAAEHKKTKTFTTVSQADYAIREGIKEVPAAAVKRVKDDRAVVGRNSVVTNQSQLTFHCLDFEEMSKERRSQLYQELYAESEDMMYKFQDLFSSTTDSLCTREVPVRELCRHLQCLGQLKPTFKDSGEPVLRGQLQGLRKCQSIDDAMSVVNSYCSFFNYRMLEHIINKLGTERDKENLAKYKEEFTTYGERHVFRCPSELGEINEDHVSLFVTLDEAFDNCNVNHLSAFVSNLQKVLNISNITLRLCNIVPGSLKLTFQLPLFVQQTIFPLSNKQEESLAILGIKQLFCGNYHFTRRDEKRVSDFSSDIMVLLKVTEEILHERRKEIDEIKEMEKVSNMIHHPIAAKMERTIQAKFVHGPLGVKIKRLSRAHPRDFRPERPPRTIRASKYRASKRHLSPVRGRNVDRHKLRERRGNFEDYEIVELKHLEGSQVLKERAASHTEGDHSGSRLICCRMNNSKTKTSIILTKTKLEHEKATQESRRMNQLVIDQFLHSESHKEHVLQKLDSTHSQDSSSVSILSDLSKNFDISTMHPLDEYYFTDLRPVYSPEPDIRPEFDKPTENQCQVIPHFIFDNPKFQRYIESLGHEPTYDDYQSFVMVQRLIAIGGHIEKSYEKNITTAVDSIFMEVSKGELSFEMFKAAANTLLFQTKEILHRVFVILLFARRLNEVLMPEMRSTFAAYTEIFMDDVMADSIEILGGWENIVQDIDEYSDSESASEDFAFNCHKPNDRSYDAFNEKRSIRRGSVHSSYTEEDKPRPTDRLWQNSNLKRTHSVDVLVPETSGSDSWPFCDVKQQSVNRNDPPSQLARSRSLESLRVSGSLKTTLTPLYGRTHIPVLNVAAAASLPPPIYMTIGCGLTTDGSDMESLSSQEDPFADEVVIHTRTGAYTRSLRPSRVPRLDCSSGYNTWMSQSTDTKRSQSTNSEMSQSTVTNRHQWVLPFAVVTVITVVLLAGFYCFKKRS